MCKEEKVRNESDIKSYKRRNDSFDLKAVRRRGELLSYENMVPDTSVSRKMSKRDCFIANTSLKIK